MKKYQVAKIKLRLENRDVKNKELAGIFEIWADLLDFHGNPKDRFRIVAFRNVSRTIASMSQDIVEISQQGERQLRQIPGIGLGIAGDIVSFRKTGKIPGFEIIKRTVPAGLLNLLNIPGLGPKNLQKLYLKLHIHDIETLKKAIKSGKVAKLEGLGEKSARKMLEGIEFIKSASARVPLGLMYADVMSLIDDLKTCEAVQKISHAGSLRRMCETVGDADIQAASDTPKDVIEFFKNLPIVKKVLASGSTKASVISQNRYQIDLRVVKPNEFGAALQYFTGSKQHNVHLRNIAKKKGYKLNEYGIFNGKKRVGGGKEEDMYTLLGLQMPPPELREDQGELELAASGKLPKLVTHGDIKGDLQMHSTYSDGRHSIEEMARECQELGYEYIAITDHSPRIGIVGGMTLPKIRQRQKEIDCVQKKLKIKIFSGAEVDILPDGTLDYDDKTLRMFDFVLGAIHSGFTKDNTARLIAAMTNPNVHGIAHPTGRIIGRRDAYPLDMKKVFEIAAKTKTALEIDAHFMRLDLKDTHVREAKKAGVMFTIGTDAHDKNELWMMKLGVAIARRGWLVKADILNTLPLAKFKQKLK